jgi:AcrR family transcriptional regulator
MSGEAEMIGSLHKVLEDGQDESGERMRPNIEHERTTQLSQRSHSEVVVQPSANDTHFQLPLCNEFPRSVNWKNKRVAAILETAASCFSRGGFTSTTLADIGRELGLRKSIVHYYFASKSALVREVQSFAYGHFIDTVRGALMLAMPLSAGPENEGRTIGAERPLNPPATAQEGLMRLFDDLSAQHTLLGLNIELESMARQHEEIGVLSQELGNLVSQEVARYLRQHDQSEARAELVGRLTYALLQGLFPRMDRSESLPEARSLFSSFLDELSF